MKTDNKKPAIKTETPKESGKNKSAMINASVSQVLNSVDNIKQQLDKPSVKTALSGVKSINSSLKNITLFNDGLSDFSKSYTKFLIDILGSKGMASDENLKKISNFSLVLPKTFESITNVFSKDSKLHRMLSENTELVEIKKLMGKSFPLYTGIIKQIGDLFSNYGSATTALSQKGKLKKATGDEIISSLTDISLLSAEIMSEIGGKNNLFSEDLINGVKVKETRVNKLTGKSEEVEVIKSSPFLTKMSSYFGLQTKIISEINKVFDSYIKVISSNVNLDKSQVKKFQFALSSLFGINKYISNTFAQEFELQVSATGDGFISKQEAQSTMISTVMGNLVSTLDNMSLVFERVGKLKFKPFNKIQRLLFQNTLKNIVKIYSMISDELRPLIDDSGEFDDPLVSKTEIEKISEQMTNLTSIADNITNFLKKMMKISILSMIALPIITIGIVALAGVIKLTKWIFRMISSIDPKGDMVKSSTVISAVSKAMLVMVVSLALTGIIIIAAMKYILVGILGFALVVGTMWLLSKLVINVTGDFVKAGLAILIISGVMIAMSLALLATGLILGYVEWTGLVTNLFFMSIIFAVWGTIAFGVGLYAPVMILGGIAMLAIAGSMLLTGLVLMAVSKLEIDNVDTQVNAIGHAMFSYIKSMPNFVSMTLAMISAAMSVVVVGSMLLAAGILLVIDNIEFKKSDNPTKENKGYQLIDKVQMIGDTIRAYKSALPGPIQMTLAAVASLGAIVVVTSLILIAGGLKIVDSLTFDNVETNLTKISDVLFGKDGFVSKLPGLGQLIKITANIIPILGLAAMISSLGGAIQSIAGLRMPTGFDKNGKALGYREMEEGDFTKAGNNISKCLIAILDPLAKFTMEHPEYADVFAPKGLFFGNSVVGDVIHTSKDLGVMISGLAEGVKGIAGLQIADKWDKDGKPIHFVEMVEGHFTAAGTNISAIIVAMLKPLAALAVDPTYEGIFKKGWLGGDSKVAAVINTSKSMMDVIGGIAKDIVGLSQNKFVGPDGKAVVLGPTDITAAGKNVQSLLSELVTAISGVDEPKTKSFDKLSTSYGKFVERINSADINKLKAANDMMKNLADFSVSINGNFDKLADTINIKLITALEELKKTLDGVGDMNVTTNKSVVVETPIKSPATPDKPVTASLATKVDEKGLANKIDDLINEIKQGVAIKNLNGIPLSTIIK